MSSSSSSGRHCVGNPTWHFINQPTAGANASAHVQVGDNAQGGAPEFTLSGSDDEGQRTWDSDLVNSDFDSGGVGFCFAATAGGGDEAISWMVNGGNPERLFSDTNFDTIDQLEIVAKGKNGGRMRFLYLTVTFFKGGAPTQTIIIPEECHPDSDLAQQVLQIVPSADDNTGVVVTGAVQLERPQRTLPASDDMTGSINLFATP